MIDSIQTKVTNFLVKMIRQLYVNKHLKRPLKR